MNSLGSAITKYLTIPSYYFNAGSTTGKPLYEAWDSVRDIALALLAIITLVMVFSQAVSIGPFDAYTVKKVLPRLIIAGILYTILAADRTDDRHFQRLRQWYPLPYFRALQEFTGS